MKIAFFYMKRKENIKINFVLLNEIMFSNASYDTLKNI